MRAGFLSGHQRGRNESRPPKLAGLMDEAEHDVLADHWSKVHSTNGIENLPTGSDAERWPISALAWHESDARLLFGLETGRRVS
jgi:hypothetical protein